MQNYIKIVRAVFEIWAKNIKNTPKRGVFPHLRPPKNFFKNRALSLLYPYGALSSCKKLEKSLEQSLRYLKTDGPRTTDIGDYIGPLWINRGPKFEISHLVCKLWVCKVQKRSNSSFLEMYLIGVVT